MKVLSIVGTRPNFLKELVLQRALAATDVEEVVVHTGQHFDNDMSQIFFDDLGLAPPHYQAEVGEGESTRQLAAMLTFLDDVLSRERPDVTLVYGDVTSTVAGAWASSRRGIPTAHVEAGVRTDARANPEEINRRLVDHLSHLLFANVKESYENLLREGFSPRDVYLPGDVVMDVLLLALERFQIDVRRGDYSLATVHRAENVTSLLRLEAIVEGLAAAGQRVIFPVHPRTRRILERNGLMNKLASGPVEVLPAQGYPDFLKLLAGADKVISDSGGVRREAFILGKPVISLIELVWVPSMVESGWELVVGPDAAGITAALADFEPTSERPAIFGDGHAAERIAATLRERFGP